MKDYVAQRSRQEVSKTDILAINSQAIADRNSGNTVINASTGVFLNEDRKLGSVKLISDALETHITDKLSYSNVYGDEDYLSSVMTFIFKEREKELSSLYYPFIGSTLGGTGAISIAFHLFQDENQSVLLPSIMWTNYMLIAKKASLTYKKYEMFTTEGTFNLQSVKEKIEEAKKKHDRVLLVINDPCHNPTGYCMSEEEYDGLFALLDEEGKDCNLTVLFDIAYIAFFHIPNRKCALIDKLLEKKHSFMPLIAFSCSKVFGLYGLRVGAFIALPSDKDESEEISRAFGAEARGTYSVPNGPVQHCIGEVLKDEKNLEELEDEINLNTMELARRSKVLLSSLEKNHIPHYPYSCGFFVSLKVKDANRIAEEMKKEHMYVVPIAEDTLRLAISGMTEKEIVTLVDELKKHL